VSESLTKTICFYRVVTLGSSFSRFSRCALRPKLFTVPGISATPFEDNMRYFNVVVEGPADTPFESGKFKLELFLPVRFC
jgi:hypothetical protein